MFGSIAPALQSSSASDSIDGLAALTHYVRRAAAADVLLAFEAGIDGVAWPLAASPEIAFAPFSVTSSMLNAMDWSWGPIPSALVNLPSTILVQLDRAPARVWMLPAPVPDALDSGILFIWLEDDVAFCDRALQRDTLEQLSLMAPVFAQMMSDRSRLLSMQLAAHRFEDMFGSVPNGVVIVEGHGQTGLINEQMASLLGIAAGEKTLGEISTAMRSLRERCLNSQALGALYRSLQHDLDFEARAIWDLGAQKLDVKTHPILGRGRNGRIWLFQDVTAQHIVDENLRRMALTDALTGLANRRHFLASAEILLAEPAPAAMPVAALMMDIDHFKSINDRYGHQAGDIVLRAVSSRMKAVLRQTDLLSRIGGEEFAVLLSGLTAIEVVDVAERLLQAVAAASIVAAGEPIEVRISMGAVQRREDETLDELMRRADAALYTAKSTGRNRLINDFGVASTG